MFDIAWSELLLIAVLALVFIGPKELPHVLHSLGKLMGKLRRSADDFRRQFEDSIRDTGYEDLSKNLQDFKQLNPASQLRASIDRALNSEELIQRSGPVIYTGEMPGASPSASAEIVTPPAEGGSDAAAISDSGVSAHNGQAGEGHHAAPSSRDAVSDGHQHSGAELGAQTNGGAGEMSKPANLSSQDKESEHHSVPAS